MKERIAKIMQKEALTAGQFAEKIGISPASLSHILSGRNNPSLDVMMKIQNTFNYVTYDWLLNGKGDLDSLSSSEKSQDNGIYNGLPFDENSIFSVNRSEDLENRKEMEAKSSVYTPKEVVREQVKYVEIPSKKITEIRIFFDNGTYETFHPEK